MKHFRLDASKNAVPCSLEEWAFMFRDFAGRMVAETQVAPGISVRTMFIGLDHDHDEGGPPEVFETMVFDGYRNAKTFRHRSWAEAEEQHLKLGRQLRAKHAGRIQDR